MAFKPIDPKRDEFRRYLERSGVIEALTKVFVRIVKERPENPLEYLRHNLGDSLHQADNVAYLQTELQEARCEIQRLRDIIENVSPDALIDVQQQSCGDVDSVASAANEEKTITTMQVHANGVEQNEAENNKELNVTELVAKVQENVENLAATVASTEAIAAIPAQTILTSTDAAQRDADIELNENEAQNSSAVNKNHHIGRETIPSAPIQQTEADNNC